MIRAAKFVVKVAIAWLQCALSMLEALEDWRGES